MEKTASMTGWCKGSVLEVLLFSTDQPPIQAVPGHISPEVKQPGSEADHPSPSSAIHSLISGKIFPYLNDLRFSQRWL